MEETCTCGEWVSGCTSQKEAMKEYANAYGWLSRVRSELSPEAFEGAKRLIDEGPREFHRGDNLVETFLSWICTFVNDGKRWADEDPFIRLDEKRSWG